MITIGNTDLVFSYLRPDSLPDLTGCVVAERYRLGNLLRNGSKGVVYAGRHEGTKGDVAIKLLDPTLMRYRRYRDMFRQEAQSAGNLRHPHICSVIDYGPTTLRPPSGGSLVTEFICSYLMTGGSLSDRLERGTPVGTSMVAAWLVAVGGALDYAHRHDVLHGDLKPSAIVFDEDEHPYLTDFAIGQRLVSEETRLVAGTPPYMAPELWENGSATPATDQFALASIFYYVLTGSRPFVGNEDPEVRRRTFRQAVFPADEEAARNGRRGVPYAVSPVFTTALAVDPAGRFESVGAFAAAFAGAVGGDRQTRRYHVFISYEREASSSLTMLIVDQLRASGLSVYVDKEAVQRVGPFLMQVERAIEDADVFVCLLAEATLKSAPVLAEIRAAHRLRKPMIPVIQEGYRAGDSSAEPALTELMMYHGVEFFDKSNHDLYGSAAALVRLVSNFITERHRG